RPAQPGDAPVVLVQPGEDLAGKRPRADRTEESAEADGELTRPAGDVRAEDRERRVDDRAVRVVPAAVRFDRPADGGSAPERKRDQRQQRDDAGGKSARRGERSREEDRGT